MMDNFSYYDIFQTKGIEYLIIIAFLLLLIPFWIIINHKMNWVTTLKNSVNLFAAQFMKLPKGIYFSSNHTWVFMQKSGLVEVGIDDWLRKLLGDSEFYIHKGVGEKVQKGEYFAEIVNQNRTLKICSPISGIFIKTVEPDRGFKNSELNSEGALAFIKPTAWKEETRTFLIGDEVHEWINNEIQHLKDFMAGSATRQAPDKKLILQEGGELKEGILAELDVKDWLYFQKEFLESKRD